MRPARAPESPTCAPPPRDLAELRARAEALAGLPLARIGSYGGNVGANTHRKGKFGQTLERLLGARAGSEQVPDFPELGVELKSIPVDARGRPRESTFVTTFALADAETATWESSSVRLKLRHVLFVPLLLERDEPCVGEPLFWRPTLEQEAVLRADFDDIVGLIALGRVEALSARLGRWLQARPKAAHGGVRTRAYGEDDEPLYALPRGLYLRARVTAALLADPTTLAFSD